MPHQIIEYSANLDNVIDIPNLVSTLHEHAASFEVLPTAGLRTRSHSTSQYQIADGHADNGFIAVCLRIGEGRDKDTRKKIGESLFQRLCDYVEQNYVGPKDIKPPIAISYEVQEIESAMRWNKNHIRAHLERRGVEYK